MKHVVYKAYWDYEKEEKWINEMAAKGMALTDYSWCRYAFAETPENEYSYRIELLENLPTHAESIAYIRFLEESGVECVATYMRFVYLRKKVSEGVFEIYSDNESKIKHYKRINAYWNTFVCGELAVGLSNVFIGVRTSEGFPLSNINSVAGGILVLIGLLFLKLSLKTRKRIRILQQEKAIRE